MITPFNLDKTIQASAVLAKQHSNRISRLRLLKLLYISDRESIRETGRPITGDSVVAMKNGPVLSRTYNLIKGESLAAAQWDHCFSNLSNRELQLIDDPGNGQLSRHDIATLIEVAQRFAACDDWDVAEHTHTFPEWLKHRPNGNTSARIAVDDVLEALGMSLQKETLLAEAKAEEAVDNLLSTL
jgi:uncharacterized phage-associated protein